MTNLADALVFLDKIGLTDVVLPFVLVFTLVYALLERTKVLGTQNGMPKHNINAMVAFCLAFTTIAAIQVVGIVQLISQYIAITTIIALSICLVLGVAGIKTGKKPGLIIGAGMLLAGLVAMHVFGVFEHADINKHIVPALGIAAFVLLMAYLLKEEKKPEKAEKPVAKKKAEEREEEKKEEKAPEKFIPKPSR